MSDVVIRAEGLSKKYLIGHQAHSESYTALRDVVAHGAKRLARAMLRGRQLVAGEVEEFWALKDVNFEIKRGDVVGIIGRNGAGKSTLLKILSRITEPSAGRVSIKGRVASLLEVGTGFHPELTGRENIFLNGAILGMTRAEIRRKFDEIVAFAEIEKFLDTPVKRYSSGMYVRLAFAVAAHLEPEILIVDEVLAVGDAEFQKKCLGKMGDVAGRGRTVLFVSHNMQAVRALCPKAILMTKGRSSPMTSAAEAVNGYIEVSANNIVSSDPTVYDNPFLVINEFRFHNNELSILGFLKQNDPQLMISVEFLTQYGEIVLNTTSRDVANVISEEITGRQIRFTVPVPRNVFNSGRYEARLSLFLYNKLFIISPKSGPRINFEFEISGERDPRFLLPRSGIIAIALPWSVEEVSELA